MVPFPHLCSCASGDGFHRQQRDQLQSLTGRYFCVLKNQFRYSLNNWSKIIEMLFAFIEKNKVKKICFTGEGGRLNHAEFAFESSRKFKNI